MRRWEGSRKRGVWGVRWHDGTGPGEKGGGVLGAFWVVASWAVDNLLLLGCT